MCRYEARLLGRGLTDIRGGRRALMKALEKSLENLQSTRIDLYQVHLHAERLTPGSSKLA